MAGGSYIALSRDLGGAQSNETDSSGIVAPAGMDLEEDLPKTMGRVGSSAPCSLAWSA